MRRSFLKPDRAADSQGSGVPRCTEALAGLVMTGGAVEALALQQAVLGVEAGVAGLLAAPALEPVGADAGSGDRVALGPVAALTAVGAVGAPEVALAAWTEESGSTGGSKTSGQSEEGSSLRVRDGRGTSAEGRGRRISQLEDDQSSFSPQPCVSTLTSQVETSDGPLTFNPQLLISPSLSI